MEVSACLPSSAHIPLSPDTRLPCYVECALRLHSRGEIRQSGSQVENPPPTSASRLATGRGNKSATQSYSIITASIGTLDPRIADLRNAAGIVTLLALGTSSTRCRSRKGHGRAVDRRIAGPTQHRRINYRGGTSSRCMTTKMSQSPMEGNPWLRRML